MWKWIILALLAVAIWQWKIRERFEPTATIKAPPYDEAETKRIVDMMPPETKKDFEDMFLRDNARATEDNVAKLAFMPVIDNVRRFYQEIYSNAKQPITQLQIDRFVEDKFPPPSPPAPGEEPPSEASLEDISIKRDAVKQILKSYFMDQPAVSTPTASASTSAGREAAPDVMPEAEPQETPRSYSSEFERTLDLYRSNLSQYKVSGNVSFKTASDNAKKWLDEYIASIQTSVEADGKELRDFVKGYEESDKEMIELKSQMADIRAKGPQLQTIYDTEHESQKEPPVDYSQYYTKGGVFAGVVAMALVASVF